VTRVRWVVAEMWEVLNLHFDGGVARVVEVDLPDVAPDRDDIKVYVGEIDGVVTYVTTFARLKGDGYGGVYIGLPEFFVGREVKS
jgi:hypothetical protein